MKRTLQIIRLRRRVGKFLLRRSLAGRKVGRDVTSRPPDELIFRLDEVFRSLRLSDSWRSRFYTDLRLWIVGEQHHSVVTSALRGIEPDPKWIPEQAFVIAQVCSALGLFEVALGFEQWAVHRIRQTYKSPRSRTDFIELIQVAIHSADLDTATEFSRRLTVSLSGQSSVPFSIRDLVNYVEVWAGRPTSLDRTSSQNVEQEDRWERIIRNQQVVIYGPGMVDPTHRRFTDGELIARVAGPGSFTWHDAQDLAGGRADLVYLIPETLESIVSADGQSQAILEAYGMICVKKSMPLYLPNARQVEPGSRLYLRGHPNMVPLICVDLIRLPGTTGYVVGSDFFSSQSSYRPESRRVDRLGAPQTAQGSSGRPFDRTTLMASHNAFQNRRIVVNLVDSGRISGDDNFLSACALSDLDYARRLDFFYGQHKI